MAHVTKNQASEARESIYAVWDLFNRADNLDPQVKTTFTQLLSDAYTIASKLSRNVNAEGWLPEFEHTMTFMYHGFKRVIGNPVIDLDRGLLKGFELTRGTANTNAPRSYKLAEVNK